MNLSSFLVAGSAAGIVIGGLSGVILSKNREEAGLRLIIAGHAACAAAIESGGKLDVCPVKTAEAAVTARRARACDKAMTEGQAFMVSASCSTPVMTVVADRDAKARETVNLSDILDRLRRDQAAAITRAEARGRTQTMRTNRAEDDLAQAPLAADGLGRCDAECLRNLGRD